MVGIFRNAGPLLRRTDIGDHVEMSGTASNLAGRLDRHVVGGHRKRDTAGNLRVLGRAGQGRGGTLVATRRHTEQFDGRFWGGSRSGVQRLGPIGPEN